MNFSSLLAIGASGLSVLLSLWLFVYGFMNGSQQSKWQEQQQELQNHQTQLSGLQQKAQGQQQQIQAGRQLGEIGPKVLQEMAGFAVAAKPNEKIKSLLAKHGITAQATPAATPGSTPAGTRPAVPTP